MIRISKSEEEILKRLKAARESRGDVDPSVDDDLPVLEEGKTTVMFFGKASKKKGEQK